MVPTHPPCARQLTPTADDGSHEERDVAVVQLQRVELHGEVELGLHDVAEGLPKALEKLPGDEAAAIGHQHPEFP